MSLDDVPCRVDPEYLDAGGREHAPRHLAGPLGGAIHRARRRHRRGRPLLSARRSRAAAVTAFPTAPPSDGGAELRSILAPASLSADGAVRQAMTRDIFDQTPRFDIRLDP